MSEVRQLKGEPPVKDFVARALCQAKTSYKAIAGGFAAGVGFVAGWARIDLPVGFQATIAIMAAGYLVWLLRNRECPVGGEGSQ